MSEGITEGESGGCVSAGKPAWQSTGVNGRLMSGVLNPLFST